MNKRLQDRALAPMRTTALAREAVRAALRDVPYAFAVQAKTESEQNRHGGEHWSHARRRLGGHASQAALVGTEALRKGPPWPPDVAGIAVRLTRFAPKTRRTDRRTGAVLEGLDRGNLESSQKGIQDGVARALRVDDGDLRIRWHYAQQGAPPFVYFVLVEIKPLRAAECAEPEGEWWKR